MFLLALAPLALAGAVAGPAAGATAATATAAGCSAWNGAQPVSPAQFSPLNGIAAVSPCDVWAVGFQESTTTGGDTQPLIEHWTGSSWATVPAGASPGTLEDVSAVSASDIWASGNTPDGALILHYDGTSWTQKPTPHDGDGSDLTALDGRTASDAWAGGHNNPDGSESDRALMMHWDGTSWTPSSLPPAVTGDNTDILSVSADSATDAWAVAQVGDNPVLLHWNGSQWASSTVPGIWSVTALSPTSAWGMGYSTLPGGFLQTLTEHWDGTSWNVVPSPNPGGAGRDNVLTAMTATSGSDVWAVGRYNGSLLVPFAMHWNGSSWTVVSLPARESQAIDTDPLSASAAAPGQAWISGASGPDANGRFIPFAVPVPVVPDVSGDTVSAATSALTAAGLTVSSTQNTTTNCSPSISSQIDVVSTDPATGQQASFGQAVTLTVCRVTVINPTVTVPDVTGEDDASARADITSAGLHAGTITLKVNCTIPRGTVLSQTPAGGTTAPFGSSVSLTEATRSGSAVHQITPHFCTQ